jgi:release factor glutamine methyltransferase
VQIIATDISLKALMVALKNINNHHFGNTIRLVQTYLLDCVFSKFHIICANLPYVPSSKLCDLSITNYEPRGAIDGGKDGLFFIRQLFHGIQEKLHPKGMIIIEIESTQESGVVNIFNQSLPSASYTILNDFAGHPRTVVIRMDK